MGFEASKRIFKIIDKMPKISLKANGIKPERLEGKIEFRNVSFAYPKDKSRLVLNNLSVKFDIKSTALVGESGCGKSTIVQLLMRIYDPDEGEISIDGYNLK